MPKLGIGIIVRSATSTTAPPSPMSFVLRLLRWVGSPFTILLVLVALVGRAQAAWRRRGQEAAARAALPSLYDRYPQARSAPPRRIGLRSVPLDRIVGTVRHPSQNTADFLPLRRLRGANWNGRWQRITGATDRLEVLPPVDLIQVGDEYYVVDGHNRIAAALRAGALEIDADVTQLLIPGIAQTGHATLDATSMLGSEEVRQAASGRLSRTVEQRTVTDELPRSVLLDDLGGNIGADE
jgi:hypothetical protein